MHDVSTIDSRYQVLRTIGVGGMGVVYLVVDTLRSNQIMALKTLKAVHDEQAVENFRSEFRSIRGVKHPHIPEMFDFGSLPKGHGHFFTCEFIDGKPLDQLVGEWQPDQLRTVLVSLCQALAFLHSHGLLHRDIKPDNVLGQLNSKGEFTTLKLVDFGLAGEHESMSEEAGGTLDYMAPEIVQSGHTSKATDLYALGMLMYRLAVGRLPFEGDDAIAKAHLRTRQETPHPLRFRPDLPVGLGDVIAALVQTDPAERPLSARHAIALLNERDGYSFDYETAETRKAYISSSGLVTNVAARNELSELRGSLILGEQPENILVVAAPGLGRSRLLKESALELTMSGLAARVITNVRDLQQTGRYPDALLIPDADSLPDDVLRKTVQSAAARSTWWIIAGTFDNGIPQWLSDWKRIQLSPLDAIGIDQFVTATFPDNSFPPDFRKRLMGQTLGYPSALEAALEKLVNSDYLRIGLTGWELMPGRWKLQAHHHVELAVTRKLEQISDCARALLTYLSCSLTPLPLCVVKGAMGSEVCADSTLILNAVAETGWVVIENDHLDLAHETVKSLIASRLEDYERRSVHAALYRFWKQADDVDDTVRTEELLFHDTLSGMFTVPPDVVARLYEEATRKGKLLWARKALEHGRSNAPSSHRNALTAALSRLEYIEGNIACAADLLGELTDNGKAAATTQNLLHLSRFASLREKLGHVEEAEEILNRCLPVFNDDTSHAAGSVYGTLAWIAFKRGEGEFARKLAEDGLVHMRADSTDSGFALLLNTVASLAYYRGDTDVARVYWQRCLEVYEALADRKGIANMYNNLGVLAAQAGDRLRARNLWERCVEISKENDNIQQLAGIYNNLGIASLETGDLHDAEENYLRALALFRRMESPREQAEILSNLGELAYQRADFPRAMAYLSEAVKQAGDIGDQETQIEPQIYLGKLLLTLEELEKSENILHEAQGTAATSGTRKAEGRAWEGLAELFARRGEFDRADAAADRAQELLADEADPLALLHLHLTRCQIAAECGRPDAVEFELEQARKVANTKWDPFTAARTQVTESLYACSTLEPSKWRVALRKLSIYPDLLWKFHWATARQFARAGQPKKALDEYGRGVAVLKTIAARLPEQQQNTYLHAPHIQSFREEAIQLRKSIQDQR